MVVLELSSVAGFGVSCAVGFKDDSRFISTYSSAEFAVAAGALFDVPEELLDVSRDLLDDSATWVAGSEAVGDASEELTDPSPLFAAGSGAWGETAIASAAVSTASCQ